MGGAHELRHGEQARPQGRGAWEAGRAHGPSEAVMLHGEPATKGTPKPASATPRRRVAELLRRGGVQQRVLKQVRVQSHAEERAAAMQRPGGVGVRVGVCWRPERRVNGMGGVAPDGGA